MFDEREAVLTFGTTRGFGRINAGLRGNGVGVSGLGEGNVVGKPTRKPVATTGEALEDGGLLI